MPNLSVAILGAVLGSCMAIMVTSTPVERTSFANSLIPQSKPNNPIGSGIKTGDDVKLTSVFKKALKGSESCSLEVANTIGRFLAEEKSSTRVGKLLLSENEKEQCRNSLASLADEFNAQLPKDDGMQTLLFNLKQDPDQQYPQDTGDFLREYKKDLALADVLLAIAKQKSITLFQTSDGQINEKYNPNQGDSAEPPSELAIKMGAMKFKQGIKRYEDDYEEMLAHYIVEPCERHSKLHESFIKFIGYLLVDSDQSDMPQALRDIIYRSRVCEIFADNSKLDLKFLDKVKRKALYL